MRTYNARTELEERQSWLLQEVSRLVKLSTENKSLPGGSYDFLTAMELDRKETIHCRFLCDLLRPDGSHHMGNVFLTRFFEMIREADPLFEIPETCNGLNVYREFDISQYTVGPAVTGRIDLLIQGKDICIPIEVKIDASDQKSQIERYSNYARNAKYNKVYYLTLDGHEPSKASRGKCRKDEYGTLSFSNDIIGWLEDCAQAAWNVPDVLSLITQYINLMRRLTGDIEGDQFMSLIKDDISNSKDYFKSATAIAEVLNSVRAEKMTEFMSHVHAYLTSMIEEYHIGNLVSAPDFDERKWLKTSESYYAHFYGNARGHHYPSFSFYLPKLSFKDYKMRFVFEIDRDLYYGLNCCDMLGKGVYGTIPGLADIFDNPAWKDKASGSFSAGWIWRRWLPNNTPGPDSESLNFALCSGTYLDTLYDSSVCSELLDKIANVFIAAVQNVNKTGLPLDRL